MVVCGGVWWFAVVCGGLRWFVVDCGGLSFSHTGCRLVCLGPGLMIIMMSTCFPQVRSFGTANPVLQQNLHHSMPLLSRLEV